MQLSLKFRPLVIFITIMRLYHEELNYTEFANLHHLKYTRIIHTLIVTIFWLSDAVEKICAFLVGITEFLGINFVITPPTVSIPKVNGLTSRRTSSPEIMKINIRNLMIYINVTNSRRNKNRPIAYKNCFKFLLMYKYSFYILTILLKINI